jgi:hypothetical protein
MPAPTQMSDLSTTAASNTPAGGEAIGTSLDDYLRGVQAVVRLEQSLGTIASAATTDLSTINEKSIAVTGTTTITGLGTESAGITKQLRFAGALTLTHSASLYLIGAANITTVAEDVADFLSLGSGNWKMTGYSRALTTSVTASQISDSTAVGRGLLTAASAAAQVALLPIPYDIVVAISDESTALTTGTAKVTIRAPRAMTLSTVLGSLNTVSSSGTPTFDVNVNGSTILSTKLTIDVSEKTSTTAAVPVVLSSTAIALDDEITFDIDVAGTGAKGAKIVLKGTTP